MESLTILGKEVHGEDLEADKMRRKAVFSQNYYIMLDQSVSLSSYVWKGGGGGGGGLTTLPK